MLKSDTGRAARGVPLIVLPLIALLLALTALSGVAAGAGRRAPSAGPPSAHLASGYSYPPLTPWRKPRVSLPQPRMLQYSALAEAGFRQAARWGAGRWYCEFRRCRCPHCSHGYFPLATIWGAIPLFESADALQLADPTRSHRARVDRFAHAFESYWDARVHGFAPYPHDRGRGVKVWFDDNGWIGLAFINAYRATGERAYLNAADSAFTFAVRQGWDAAKGGGMWWNTSHPYHSGPALSSESLLGVLLYGEDHQSWQLEDVKMFVDWANANDDHDERQLYLEKPNEPNSVNDYVQAPLIYAQYLLCQDGEGEAYCERAGRVAATMSEQNAIKSSYRCNYGPEYDAIYLQWMMAYGVAAGDPYWTRLAEVNAAAAERHAADREGLWLQSWWGGPIADPRTQPQMLRTESATTSLFAWLALYSQ